MLGLAWLDYEWMSIRHKVVGYQLMILLITAKFHVVSLLQGAAKVHNKSLYHSAWADQRLAPVLQIICNLVYKWL